jgi:hypothetical protein
VKIPKKMELKLEDGNLLIIDFEDVKYNPMRHTFIVTIEISDTFVNADVKDDSVKFITIDGLPEHIYE